MMLVLSRYLLVLGAVVASLAGAAAQQYPAKTITLVVPAAPGGVTDILARSLGQRFRESFGQPVVVENKPGASNQIAAEYVARSSGDGYTLLVSPEATVAINPYLFGKLRYDAAKDFVPVAGLVKIHQALVTNPSVPAHSVADFIALAKKQPGSLNYGTYGVGSTGHLNMEMFEAMAAVQLVAIHYKGATPALTDVIAGHIQAMFISVGSAIQPWKAGELNLLAVGSKERLASFPTSRRSPRAACPVSRRPRGSGCSRRPALRRQSSISLMRRRNGFSPSQDFAPQFSIRNSSSQWLARRRSLPILSKPTPKNGGA